MRETDLRVSLRNIDAKNKGSEHVHEKFYTKTSLKRKTNKYVKCLIPPLLFYLLTRGSKKMTTKLTKRNNY